MSFRHSEFAELEQDAGLSLENDLRNAIERGELHLHYQLQIDIRTGRITKVEALARWPSGTTHAAVGSARTSSFPSPSATVPSSPWASGCSIPACRQAAQWRAQGLEQACVAANLSAVQFDRSDLQAVVLRAMTSSGLSPQALEIEVTEALALRHMTSTAVTSAALRQAGSVDAVIIGALVTLADGMDLELVAEGVETQQVSDLLQALGCRTMQGYLFGRSLAAPAMTALWRARSAMHAPLARSGRSSAAQGCRAEGMPGPSPAQ